MPRLSYPRTLDWYSCMHLFSCLYLLAAFRASLPLPSLFFFFLVISYFHLSFLISLPPFPISLLLCRCLFLFLSPSSSSSFNFMDGLQYMVRSALGPIFVTVFINTQNREPNPSFKTLLMSPERKGEMPTPLQIAKSS